MAKRKSKPKQKAEVIIDEAKLFEKPAETPAPEPEKTPEWRPPEPILPEPTYEKPEFPTKKSYIQRMKQWLRK